MNSSAAVAAAMGAGSGSALRAVVTADERVMAFYVASAAAIDAAMRVGGEDKKTVRARFKHTQNVMVGRIVTCSIRVDGSEVAGNRQYALLGIAECPYLLDENDV